MHKPDPGRLRQLRNKIAPVLMGPPVLAFLPALTLAMFWLGGEQALLIAALGLPVLFALAGGFGKGLTIGQVPRDSVTGMMLRQGFEQVMEGVFAETVDSDLRSAVFIVDIDDFRDLSTARASPPATMSCSAAESAFWQPCATAIPCRASATAALPFA